MSNFNPVPGNYSNIELLDKIKATIDTVGYLPNVIKRMYVIPIVAGQTYELLTGVPAAGFGDDEYAVVRVGCSANYERGFYYADAGLNPFAIMYGSDTSIVNKSQWNDANFVLVPVAGVNLFIYTFRLADLKL